MYIFFSRKKILVEKEIKSKDANYDDDGYKPLKWMVNEYNHVNSQNDHGSRF